MRHPGWTFIVTAFIALLILTGISPAENSKNNASPLSGLKERALPIKPAAVKISPAAEVVRVVVKFREGSGMRLRDDRLVSLSGQSSATVNNILKPYFDGRLARLVEGPEEDFRRMKMSLQAKTGMELADFNLYYELAVTDGAEAAELVRALNRLGIVEIAYAEPRSEVAEDIDPPTSDYEPYQYYLLEAPIGVDAVYANTLPGGDGTGVKIIDIEHFWNENHEDLEKAAGATIGPGNAPDGHHGTAVIGEMIGGDNGYGVTGICPGADIGMISAGTYGCAEAILMAVENLERGDLILIELHAPGPRYDFEIRSDQLGYVCMEYWQANFDAIQYAWASGMIVVEAAGNGAENLDDALYGPMFDTTYRNSHAIMAGAGAPPSGAHGADRSRLDFSNHGERVNLQGYGREVFTTGYGYYWDGDGDINQYYTATFSGTSSASPIVTGAVACLQGYYKQNYGVPMTADVAREVFYTTGSPQQGDTTGEHIGPRPDLAAAIAALTAPPSLYSEPIMIDTTLDPGTSAAVAIWLYNRSIGDIIDYDIYGTDSLLKDDIPDWITVVPEAGTLAPQDSVLLTATIDASVLENRLTIYKGIIEINWGISGGPADMMTYVPVFLEVPCQADTTFGVASSNDPGGPTYNWIELIDAGTVIPHEDYYNSYAANPLDDGTAGPIALPFSFPYFGTDYDSVYIAVNGGISFTDVDVNSNGYYSNFDIPGAPFETFIGVLWNDLIIGETHAAHGDIYYYTTPTSDSFIVEWWQMGNYNSPVDTLTTFEIILTADGDITMQYKDVGFSGLNETALIGLSEVECTSSPYFDAGEPVENTVSDQEAVLFDLLFQSEMAGDANGDDIINILDITCLIDYLYKGGPAPIPEASGDVNCDAIINILDITYLINYLYKDGTEPCYYSF